MRVRVRVRVLLGARVGFNVRVGARDLGSCRVRFRVRARVGGAIV